MANMSYCRFRNTVTDLADCRDALDALFDEGKPLSPDELRAAERLVAICAEITEAMEGVEPLVAANARAMAVSNG